MDELVKNIKKKLSVDNLVEMMKDAKVIDDNRIKEEDVRKTLEKIDTNNLIDVDDLAMKLNEISEQSRVAAEDPKPQSKPQSEPSKFGFSFLRKSPPEPKEEDINVGFQDNVTGFLD